MRVSWPTPHVNFLPLEGLKTRRGSADAIGPRKQVGRDIFAGLIGGQGARDAGSGVVYRNHRSGDDTAGLIGNRTENASRIDLSEQRITSETKAHDNGGNEKSFAVQFLNADRERQNTCEIPTNHKHPLINSMHIPGTTLKEPVTVSICTSNHGLREKAPTSERARDSTFN